MTDDLLSLASHIERVVSVNIGYAMMHGRPVPTFDVAAMVAEWKQKQLISAGILIDVKALLAENASLRDRWEGLTALKLGEQIDALKRELEAQREQLRVARSDADDGWKQRDIAKDDLKKTMAALGRLLWSDAPADPNWDRVADQIEVLKEIATEERNRRKQLEAELAALRGRG